MFRGQVLKLPRKPQRIVTLALSSDEMALAMLPAQRLAALHYLADDPGISTEVAKAQAVTARVRDYNVEQLLSLQPDLVLAPDWNRQELGFKHLRDAGLPVVVTKGPSSVAEVKEALQQIALAAGAAGGTKINRTNGTGDGGYRCKSAKYPCRHRRKRWF